MDKLKKLLAVLLIAIIAGACATAPAIELPPPPEREEIADPPAALFADEDVASWAAKTLLYFDSLVAKWEAWYFAVQEQVK